MEHRFLKPSADGLGRHHGQAAQQHLSPGKRSDSWLKIKTRQTIECVIIGYTRGKGDREAGLARSIWRKRGGWAEDTSAKLGPASMTTSLPAVFASIEEIDKTIRPVKEKPLTMPVGLG